jgi:hypothetical protein
MGYFKLSPKDWIYLSLFLLLFASWSDDSLVLSRFFRLLLQEVW